jgi:hypothetical protein
MPTWAFNQMNAGLTISRRCKIYNWERKSFGNTKRPSRNWKGLFALAEHRIEKVDWKALRATTVIWCWQLTEETVLLLENE